MKKKFLTFLFAICLIIPCAFIMSACGKKDKEAVAVTIEFAMDDDIQFSEDYWDIDETTNTYKTTYLNGFVWQDYMFEVIATTANGDTRNLYQATESNPMGFKIDTNMPETDGRLPVGTYTFKLYCEDFNNGEYKAEACESETYTIIIEKEPIELVGGWQYNTSPNTYNGDEIEVSCHLLAYNSDGSGVDLQDVGIKNLNIIEETCSAIEVGDYVARVEYEADTANFNYTGDGLPEKEFEWSIEKVDIGDYIDLNLWLGSSDYTYFQGTTHTIEFMENNLFEYIPLNYIGMGGTYSASQPGTYVCWPIFEQTDTENYTLITDYSEELKFTWTISAQKIYVNSDTVGLNRTSFEYDGFSKTISTALVWIYPEFVVDRVEGDTEKTNVGTYNVRVYVEPAYEGYEIDGNNYIDFEWNITKSVLYFEFDWYINGNANVTTVGYDGTSHVPVIETNLTLSAVKHYDMSGTELEAEEITEIGRYRTVAIPDYDSANYTLDAPERLEIEWEIVKGDYEVSDNVWIVQYVGDGGVDTTYDGAFLTYECFAMVGGRITLTFKPSCISPNDNLTYKFSKDNGETFVEESELVFDASTAAEYHVTVVVENQNSELYNPVNVTKLEIYIHVTEAEAE